MVKKKLTPLMEQYFAIKKEFPDAVLMFQVGDFYELFFDDAKIVSEFLAITLTKRGKCAGEDVPLCGVPLHALSHYLLKLVKGGFKVAICDQITKPKPGTVVERKVTRVYTPGTLTDSTMLDERSASYIFAFWPGSESWGLIFGELLTLQIAATVLPKDGYRQLESELVRFLPDEVLLPRARYCEQFKRHFLTQGYQVSFADVFSEDRQVAQLSVLQGGGLDTSWSASGWLGSFLRSHFETQVYQNLFQNPSLACGVGVLAKYLERNNQDALEQLHSIKFYQPDDYLILDSATQRNLEIVSNVHDGGRKNTLLSILDSAKTAMGSRTVKKWLLQPLVDKEEIEHRQEFVETILGSITLFMRLSELMGQVADLERIVGRFVLSRAGLQDFLRLSDSLKMVPQISAVVIEVQEVQMGADILAKLHSLPQLTELLTAAINAEGGDEIINSGFDLELDQLRSLVKNSQAELLKLERDEIKKTGIESLKVRYTDAFGYSIEITNTHVKKVPERYFHKQTLVGRRRYVTEELRTLESEILRAREQIGIVEEAVFLRVKNEVLQFVPQLRETAQALAVLDAIVSYAKAAYDNKYVRPRFDDVRDIIIEEGRHPVVERALQFGEFVPNNTKLTDSASLLIITGPNMGGKSTYLRQVALISLMAQTGSFVPAKTASLSIVDRIFTRIGSGDNLAAGKSTFLVEMEEAAVICRQATENSLVILDEVGRGTSTFDGMAIAQAIIEYIFSDVRARCLFATHYHELTHLETVSSGVVNYHTKCGKSSDGMVFAHKLVRGVAEGSFGVEVAKLAHLPPKVVARAHELLKSMESEGMPKTAHGSGEAFLSELETLRFENEQLKGLLAKIKALDPDDLTPRQAHEFIRGLHD